jgi:hypothetical protein
LFPTLSPNCLFHYDREILEVGFTVYEIDAEKGGRWYRRCVKSKLIIIFPFSLTYSSIATEKYLRSGLQCARSMLKGAEMV